MPLPTHTHFCVRRRGSHYVVKDSRSGDSVGGNFETRAAALAQMRELYVTDRALRQA